MAQRMVGDRLYGITIRPQELALYGQDVRFHLRYAPIFDDPRHMTNEHFKLLVLEVTATVPADESLGRSREETLDLLKCGWELTCATDEAIAAEDVAEEAGEVPMLLSRIADTVNDLARRAGLEAPMAPDLIDHLVAEYRRGGSRSLPPEDGS